MIVNLDQAPSEFVESSRHTKAENGSANVGIIGSGEKQQITATFVVTLDRRFLPMQLIYDGKTTRSITRVDFPSSFSSSANPKYFSNADESVKISKKYLFHTSNHKENNLD